MGEIGVHDLQLMEIAIRKSGRRQFVSGLARAITDYAELGDEQSEAWNDAKTRGKNLFSPEKGIPPLSFFPPYNR